MIPSRPPSTKSRWNQTWPETNQTLYLMGYDKAAMAAAYPYVLSNAHKWLEPQEPETGAGSEPGSDDKAEDSDDPAPQESTREQRNARLEEILSNPIKAIGLKASEWAQYNSYHMKQLVLARLPYVLRDVLHPAGVLEALATIEDKGAYVIDRTMSPASFRKLIEGLGVKPLTYRWGTDASHGSNQEHLFRLCLKHTNHIAGEGYIAPVSRGDLPPVPSGA